MIVLTRVGIVIAVLLLFVSSVIAGPLLDPNDMGFNGNTRSENYDELLGAMYTSGKTVTTVNGMMWVPWFKTSSSCLQNDLQSGANCNSGSSIDFNNNCMVTDEFSQVGVLVSMGKDQSKMDEFYNTVVATKSSNGVIPAWRIYKNGNSIEPCKKGINGNCDTASDATARILIALYTGAKNQYFADSAARAKYLDLASKMAQDFLNYEVDQTCRPSDLGYGQICYWLAGGSNVKRAGIGAWDFAYTGYYPDAIIAMLAAHSNTGNQKYADAAKAFTLNYLQASNFDGNSFTVPPGKSFRWVADLNGVPRAQCTNTCGPVMWDAFDASRATAMCQANYYANQMGVTLPGLENYCNLWNSRHMTNPKSAPLQYYPNGNAVNRQSGYFAQGMQSLFHSGINSGLYEETLDNSLDHYNPSTKTFDNNPCFGIYTQAFALKSLGMGIGRDLAAFGKTSPILTPEPIDPTPVPVQPSPHLPALLPAPSSEAQGIASLQQNCNLNGMQCSLASDVTNGACRTLLYNTLRGNLRVLGCEKGGNYIELYRQEAPAGVTFSSCLGNGCVTSANGFARFIAQSSSPVAPVPLPAPAPPVQQDVTSPILTLKSSCFANNCNLKSDKNTGSCRTVTWSTNDGDIQIFGCEKASNFVEIYRQTAPQGTWRVCLGNGCISNENGFARFTPNSESPVAPSSTLTQPVSQLTLSGVSTLPISIQPQGSLSVDSIENTGCRFVEYSTSTGSVQARICDKGNSKYEMYMLTPANGANICVHGNCVGVLSGFASFTY